MCVLYVYTVRSGNHVLIQAAKRLQESSQIPIETIEERPIHMKHPNNVYIVSPTSCCEVLERTYSGKLLHRVVSHLTPYLCEPCDSRIYGAFACDPSKMEILDKTNLQVRARMATAAELSFFSSMILINKEKNICT